MERHLPWMTVLVRRDGETSDPRQVAMNQVERNVPGATPVEAQFLGRSGSEMYYEVYFRETE